MGERKKPSWDLFAGPHSLTEDDACPHCGEGYDEDEREHVRTHGVMHCPTCGRDGCDKCMPAGRGCACPECEGD